jgi:hypothetical protein
MWAVIAATLSELLSQCAYGFAPTVENRIHIGTSIANAITQEIYAGRAIPKGVVLAALSAP